MSVNCKKASKIAIAWLLLTVLAGCVNNPAYTSLDGPPRASSKPSQAARPSAEAPARAPASASQPAQSVTAAPARPGHYRVQQGDTLYSIAFRFGLDFRKLAHANNIDSSYTIYPGQQLVLRESEPGSAPQSAAASSAASSQAPPRPAAREPSSSTRDVATPTVAPAPVTESNNASAPVRTSPPPTASSSSLEWVWPHDGKIVRTFNANVSDQKGVDLTGQIGDSVKAAANGTVVYAGNGLPGYGNLIIVEHPGSLLSAYAFNQELLVSERDTVSKGQVIARMGSQGDQPRLHFEIRQEGKPVDPMRYLPRR